MRGCWEGQLTLKGIWKAWKSTAIEAPLNIYIHERDLNEVNK